MSTHATERTVPITSKPSLDLLFEDFLRRATAGNGDSVPKLRDWVSLAEAWRICHALDQCRGNRTAAARLLGIGRRTLYSKMEKLEIASRYSAASAGGTAEAPDPDLLLS